MLCAALSGAVTLQSELLARRLLLRSIREMLHSYGSSIVDDVRALEGTSLSGTARVATVVRLSEKRILAQVEESIVKGWNSLLYSDSG